MHRYFVTGTDTGVGKTRVAASLAMALRQAGHLPTVIKLVQTGLDAGEPGDAQHAGELAGTPYRELLRFRKAADPWSAALAELAGPPQATELADTLAAISGPIVVEGSGGLMAPLCLNEDFGDVARRAHLSTVIVVGLRLGCMNHALLTLARCRELELPVLGAVPVECWGAVTPGYRADVERVLQGKLEILCILPFAEDERASVALGAEALQRWLR